MNTKKDDQPQSAAIWYAQYWKNYYLKKIRESECSALANPWITIKISETVKKKTSFYFIFLLGTERKVFPQINSQHK